MPKRKHFFSDDAPSSLLAFGLQSNSTSSASAETPVVSGIQSQSPIPAHTDSSFAVERHFKIPRISMGGRRISTRSAEELLHAVGRAFADPHLGPDPSSGDISNAQPEISPNALQLHNGTMVSCLQTTPWCLFIYHRDLVAY